MTISFDFIADELAEKGLAIADQFLSQKEVDDILGLDLFQERLKAFKKAGVGKSALHQVNEAIRGDYIKWVDKDAAPAAIQVYLARVNELIANLNRTLFLSLKDFELHLTTYPAGAFYKRHLDQFRGDDHRKLSVICYLNNGWTIHDGGQLRMFLDDGPLEVLPTAGRLVCFRSDQIEHEVLPAARERLSLTGWILDQYADLRRL